MAEVTATLVKELREKTGAGMMDCKKALTENDGDVEVATDWLRTKGLASAAKKAGRVASEGLVGLASADGSGAMVEINSETDFVARNDVFQALVTTVAGVALDAGGDVESLGTQAFPGEDRTVEEQVTHMIATIGENISLRRAVGLQVSPGIVASYVHNAAAPGLGKIGVLVALESSGDTQVLADFGKQLAMHIAAVKPQAVKVEDLDAAEVEKERNVLAEQARESGKPEEIVEKMVEGRIRKYYEEVVLLSQTWVIDGESKIEKVLKEVADKAGAPVEIKAFERFALGEGIEKAADNFAEEVAAAVQS